MKKILLGLSLILVTSCHPFIPKPSEPIITNPPTTVPTTNPTTEPTTVPTAEPTTNPATEPTTVPTTKPTTAPTTVPSSDPTTESSVEDSTTAPTIPDEVIPELPDEPEAGKTRIYFLAESWWHKSNSHGTAVFTDSISYPGEAMFIFEEIEDKIVYAYDVDLTSTSKIGFTCYGIGNYIPTDSVSFLDIVMDTDTIKTSTLEGDNLFALNEDEADASRSLFIFSDVYVPGQKDYERPEEPEIPDTPIQVEKTRIYFMDRDWWNLDGAKTSFYYWSTATDSGEYAWPGVTARKLETIETDMDTVVNVYYADIDTSKYDAIIFNRVNNDNIEGALAINSLNAQTADIKLSDLGENNMIILSHDEFVYNSNIKCDTIFGIYEEGKWDYGQFPTGPVVVEPLDDKITVYYSNPSWTSAYVYTWSENGNNAWPGEAMTKDAETGLWKHEISSDIAGLLFNNGQSGAAEQRTDSIVLLGYSNDKPYWNGSAWSYLPDDPIKVEKTRIYFMDRDWWNLDGAKTSFYYWSTATYSGEYAWPGVTARKLETIETNMDTVVNVYYADIDTSKYDAIIFNRVKSNNIEGAIATNSLNAQTADIKLSDLGENNMIILSHDEFVYNTNIKCDTIFGVYEEGKWDYGQFATGPVVVEPLDEKITVYYSNPSWTSAYVYTWGGTAGENAVWPGEAMTKDAETGLWKHEINSGIEGLLFNNGQSGEAEQKTDDIVLLGYSNDKPYWNGSGWSHLPGYVPEDAENITVYYGNPSNWTKVYAYVWDASSNPKVAWPGEEISKDEVTGLYTYTFTNNYVNIIFNNGQVGTGNQTPDISLRGYSADTPYYNGSSWAALPSGEDPVVPPVGPEEPETPVEPEEPTEGTFTIYFENNWDWIDATIYYWGSTTATNPVWPGILLTEIVGKNTDNYDIYKIIIPSDITGMIFNGTGAYGYEQSADITDIKNGYCYYMTYDGVTGTKPCGSYEYKETFQSEKY